MKIDRKYFIKQKYNPAELTKYKKSARRDLDIAKCSQEVEVKFHFAYMALVKIGIYCLAKTGYRVKARPGHHQKIIEHLSRALNSEDILIIGDKMRKDRNRDLYSADTVYSTDELGEYLEFIERIYEKI
jgi:hypothetical protein